MKHAALARLLVVIVLMTISVCAPMLAVLRWSFPDKHVGSSPLPPEVAVACQASAVGRPSSSRSYTMITPLSPQPERDEFGHASNFTSLSRACALLGISEEHFESDSRPPPVAVNIGARDGIGTMGNTDPTYPLFADLGFQGLAIEASSEFETALRANFATLPRVQIEIGIATPENVAGMIRAHGFDRVDVLKVDIDGWDCDVLSALLAEGFEIQAVLAEFNVKFPPPIKMRLATNPRQAYKSCARYHVYGCSLQYLNDNVMAPHGFVLAQVDWQNAMFVRAPLAHALGLPDEGVNVGEAYEAGYARRLKRSENMPWNWDIDHLLDADISPTERARRAWQYIVEGKHLQDGQIEVGCGNVTKTLRYRKTSPDTECWHA